MSSVLEGTIVVLISLAVCGWFVGGVALAFNTFERLDREGLSSRACLVGAVFSALLAPLATFVAFRWFGGACRELYRHRFPVKVELPKAQVLK
jgi:hypothetical protein